MDLSSGIGKRSGGNRKKTTRKVSKNSKNSKKSKKTQTTLRGRRNSRASRKSVRSAGRKSRRLTLPRTAALHSRKSIERERVSRANSSMSLTELQFLAKSRGIPFGGLSRAKLVKKINNYMY